MGSRNKFVAQPTRARLVEQNSISAIRIRIFLSQTNFYKSISSKSPERYNVVDQEEKAQHRGAAKPAQR